MNQIQISLEGRLYTVEVGDLECCAEGESASVCVHVDGQPVWINLPQATLPPAEWSSVLVDGRPWQIRLDPDLHWIADRSGRLRMKVQNLEKRTPYSPCRDGLVRAPIPGQVSQVLVEPGDIVHACQPVVVLDAMKMHNEIRAPRAGQVTAVQNLPGDLVRRGQVLVEIR